MHFSIPPDVAAHICQASTWKAEAGGLGLPLLYRKLEAFLGYRRLGIKKINTK